jgi:hypothetical protein
MLQAWETLEMEKKKKKKKKKKVGKPERNRSLKNGRRWDDNIRADFREAGWEFWTRCILFRIGTSSGLM